MTVISIALIGAAMSCAGTVAMSLIECHTRRERNHQAALAEFEKGRAEQLLTELHRVESESEEIIASHRRYIDELRGRIEKSEEQREAAWAQVNTEVEIRVSFQNKAHSLENAYEGMRALVGTKDREIAARESQILHWQTLYSELLKRANESIRKRDSSGRYAKKSA